MNNLWLHKDQIHQVITEVVDLFLIPKFMELGMDASGQWVQTLRVEVTDKGADIFGKFYTQWLVEGRPQNNNQSEEAINHFTRWAGHYIFKEWCRNKGIDEKHAYAIARKVAKEGTRFYPNGTDLLEVLKSHEVTQYINERLGGLMVVNITAHFQQKIKEIL